MPHTTPKKPPCEQAIIEVRELKGGKGLKHPLSCKCDREGLRERMRQSCYLNSDNRPLSPWQRCVEQYKRDGLALFLGAGVSVDSGVPSWPDLIDDILKRQRISVRSATNEKSASRILSQEARLPLAAQFDLAAAGAPNCAEVPAAVLDSAFAQRIYDSLYGKRFSPRLKKWLRGIPPAHKQTYGCWDDILGELKKNRTLGAVGELLLCEAHPANLLPNPNVPAVITLNADNLLQMYVLARSKGNAVGKCRILSTVDRPSVGEHPNMIPIFHLHGYLDVRYPPQNAPMAEDGGADRQTPTLVFRESEYFESIADTRGFANYTAHSFLQRYNVLFIGTSLDDINVRRWLHNSYHERVSHRERYLQEIYTQRYEHAKREAELASVRHFWLREENDLPEPRNKIRGYMEELMRGFGVQIIWYAEHKEVAARLLQLKAATQTCDVFA